MQVQASARPDARTLSLPGTLRVLAAALEFADGLPPVEATVHEDFVSLFVFTSRAATTFEQRQEAVRALAVLFGASEPETAVLRDGRSEHYTANGGRIPRLPGVAVTVYASRSLPVTAVTA